MIQIKWNANRDFAFNKWPRFRSSFDMRKQPCGVSKASATVALRIENYVTAKFPTND